MKSTMLKRICAMFLVIALIITPILQSCIGLWNVNAKEVTVTTYKESYVDTYSFVGKALKPQKNSKYASFYKSETSYTVTYRGSTTFKVWNDELDAYAVGKELPFNGTTVKIKSFEKGSYTKEKRSGYVFKQKHWNCTMTVEGNIVTGYLADGLSLKDFPKRYMSGIYYIELNPIGIASQLNKTTWKISIPQTVKVQQSTSTTTNNKNNNTNPIDKFASTASALAKATEQATKNIGSSAGSMSTSGSSSSTSNTSTSTNTSTGTGNTSSSGNTNTSQSTAPAVAVIDHSDLNDNARRLYIRNLYRRVLQREPSNTEIETQFSKSTYQVANDVIFSKDSNSKNGTNNMTNQQFVEVCYEYLLGRKADDNGKANWVKVLTSGLSRKDLVKKFTESKEFKQNNDKTTSTLTFDEKTCNACYSNLKDRGFAVIKPSNTTILMYSDDINKVDALNLSGKEITNLKGISSFKNLKKLSISNNKIEDLTEVYKITNLEELVMNDNNIKSLNGIGSLTKLTKLNINTNPISNMSEISKLTNLKYLYVANCKLTYFTVDLTNLTKLEEISLINNSLCTDGIAALAKGTNLKKIDLNNNKITNLSALSGLKKLEQLSVNNNLINEVSTLGNTNKITMKNNNGNLVTTSGTLDMPKLLQEVKNSNSKLYTDKDLKLTNCKIEDGKIVVNSDSSTAYIEIQGGEASGTKLKITNYINKITLKDRVLAERLKSEFGLSDITEENGEYIIIISNDALFSKRTIDLSTPSSSTEKIKDISGLERFSALTSINLRNNEISNFEVLSKLKNLQTLDVRFNNLNNLQSFKNIKSLKQLDASNNMIKNTSGIEGLENLTDLLLSNNDIKNNLGSLNKLKDNLSTLSLINNNISDVSGLSQLKLEKLYLGQNEISDISSINKEHLEVLNLENNNITLNIKGNVANLPKMIETDMAENGGVANLECTGCQILNKKIVLDDGIKTAKIKVLNGNLKDTIITIQDENAMNAPKLEVTYQLNPSQTAMTVTVRADKQIEPVLGWNRIENSTAIQKTYTYNVINQNISVRDLYGNETIQKIQFTDINNTRIPNLTVSYSENMRTNHDVTVTISSSQPLHQYGNTWILNEDGKSMSCVFTSNTNEEYTTAIVLTEEMYRIQMQPINIDIELAVIDKTAPNCTVEYSDTEKTKGAVRATIWSDEEFELVNVREYVKTKKIAENQSVKYGAILFYNDNSSELITVKDLAGNIKLVDVIVENIDKSVDGLFSKTNETNLTQNGVKLIIGANEDISIKDEASQAKLNELKMLNGDVKKLANNIRSLISKDNIMYKVASNSSSEYGFSNSFIRLADLEENNQYTQSGRNLEIDLSERELGTIVATDKTNNLDLVLFNTSMIDKSKLTITRNDIENEDGSKTVVLNLDKPIQITEELGDWRLSDDAQTLTKTFYENENEFLRFKDYLGNITEYNFTLDGFEGIEYTIYYYPIEGTDELYVIIDTNVELNELDDWEISEDKKSLCKKISQNDKIEVTIYDINGKSSDVTIYYENESLNGDLEPMEDANKGVNQTDLTQADKIFPGTGKYTLFAIVISVVLTILTSITLVNYKKNM